MATTGLQHVAAMYAGVVAPPLIVGAAIGLSATELTFLTGACLFTAGLATFLQTLGIWKIGARLPFVNGVTFAGVAPMTAVVASTDDKSDALPIIFGAVIVAGLLGFLAAPVFCKGDPLLPAGRHRHRHHPDRHIPAARRLRLGAGSRPHGGHHYGSATNLGLAAITLVIVLLLRRFTRGFVKHIGLYCSAWSRARSSPSRSASRTSARSRTRTSSASPPRSTSAPRSSRSPRSCRCAW